MDIKQYNQKNVLLIDVDDTQYNGKAFFTTSGDNDDLGEQISINDKNSGSIYEFYPNEIKSIEIIE